MKTAVAIKIGPNDHGMALDYDDFASAEWEEGYRYELVYGKLYVTPASNQPENRLEEWIGDELKAHSRARPEIINHVTSGARIFIPGMPGLTVPQPDRAAYKNFPLKARFTQVPWQIVSPFLVVEVLSPEDPDKDLFRNVELYWRVPSIKEYWIIDGRPEPEEPTLIVHRRQGSRWKIIEVPYGETYETRLLPGFKLVVDPRQ